MGGRAALQFPRMRTFASALVVLSAAAYGEDLQGNLASKLAQPFVKNAGWATDYEDALGRAKKEGKLVFAYFTRSYQP